MGACKLEAQMLDDSCAWQWPCPLSAGHCQRKVQRFTSFIITRYLQNYALKVIIVKNVY